MTRSYLTEATKLDIIELTAQKWSLRKLSKKINKPFETIRSFIQRYKNSKSIQNKNSTGRRPKLYSKSKRRLLRHVKSHRRDTLRKIHEDLQLQRVSKDTVNRILLKAGLKSCKPMKKPSLTPKHRAGRLKWAKKYAEKMKNSLKNGSLLMKVRL